VLLGLMDWTRHLCFCAPHAPVATEPSAYPQNSDARSPEGLFTWHSTADHFFPCGRLRFSPSPRRFVGIPPARGMRVQLPPCVPSGADHLMVEESIRFFLFLAQ
jgi:hypothetical protein